jgi:hypothetical protein
VKIEALITAPITGSAGPPGTRNAAGFGSRRRSCSTARHVARYCTATDTFDMPISER